MRAAGYRVESICAVLCEQGVQVAPRTRPVELRQVQRRREKHCRSVGMGSVVMVASVLTGALGVSVTLVAGPVRWRWWNRRPSWGPPTPLSRRQRFVLAATDLAESVDIRERQTGLNFLERQLQQLYG